MCLLSHHQEFSLVYPHKKSLFTKSINHQWPKSFTIRSFGYQSFRSLRMEITGKKSIFKSEPGQHIIYSENAEPIGCHYRMPVILNWSSPAGKKRCHRSDKKWNSPEPHKVWRIGLNFLFNKAIYQVYQVICKQFSDPDADSCLSAGRPETSTKPEEKLGRTSLLISYFPLWNSRKVLAVWRRISYDIWQFWQLLRH